MQRKINDFKVALVYPPFGTSGVPNLGIANISAGIKKSGFPCKVFYWNQDFLGQIPVDELRYKFSYYNLLSHTPAFPYNEWLFKKYLFPDEHSENVHDIIETIENDHSMFSPTRRRMIADGRKDIYISLSQRIDEIVCKMAEELSGFDIIGINSTYYQNLPALSLAMTVKRRWPEKIIVLGGANCYGEMGIELFKQFPFIDYLFSGESDHSFPQFVRILYENASMDKIEGIRYRDIDGNVRCGPPASPVRDLDGLPLPDYDDYVEMFGTMGYADPLVLALESSRGCWWGSKHQCIFCGLNTHNMGYRSKDTERFQWEVEEVTKKYGARILFMTDNIMPLKFYNKFVKWAGSNDIQVNFFYEIKADVSRKQVAALSQAGITYVQPGIESFSTKMLSLMRKGTTGIQNVAYLKYAEDNGVLSTYNILAGFPGEDRAEYDKVAEEIHKLIHLHPPNAVIPIEFHRFSPFHRNPELFNIKLEPCPSYSMLYPFPEEVISRIAYRFTLESPKPDPFEYLKNIQKAVSRWKKYYDYDICTLTWEKAGADILIRDRRQDFEHRDYRLKGDAVLVFLVMDEPITSENAINETNDLVALLDKGAPVESRLAGILPAGIKSITEESIRSNAREFISEVLTKAITENTNSGEVTIAFSLDDFTENPERCLKPLIDAGLIYKEEDEYVTLPVAKNRQKSVAEWAKVYT